jgi:hypothetical protein
VILALAGRTSLEEIIRVTQEDAADDEPAKPAAAPAPAPPAREAA